jgi:hypothetical protein
MSDENQELHTPTTDEKISSLLALIEEQRNTRYESHFDEILDGFEDFLINRPEPPKEWQDRFDASGKKFDYWQIVLPQDFQDPFEDDLGNIRRLRSEFSDTKPTDGTPLLILISTMPPQERG